MLFIQKSSLFFLGSMICSVFAAPVAETTATAEVAQIVPEGPFLDSRALAPTDVTHLVKRTDTSCWPGATFVTNDFWGLENSWWSHNDMYYMPAWTTVHWTWGSLKLCVANKYFSDNTHIYLRNLGDAMAVLGGCCTSDSCSGGITSIRGDSGLLVDVWAIPITLECKW